MAKIHNIDFTDTDVYNKYFDVIGGVFACAARVNKIVLKRNDVEYFSDFVANDPAAQYAFGMPVMDRPLDLDEFCDMWAARYVLCNQYITRKCCRGGARRVMECVANDAVRHIAVRLADWNNGKQGAPQYERAMSRIDMQRPFIELQFAKLRG